eukprot:TRINITY_DN2191_c0_g1_i3.p1 TRINITY_DN2191_c0_g1~~TRINITY_DN2191_c0_g1_i3.p1  ORF type:complete len:404 (+),score=69.12 TRINITY_DN2191_c0_g1_i3:86-1297(+)
MDDKKREPEAALAEEPARKRARTPEGGKQKPDVVPDCQMAETEYFFKDSLRCVRPYYHTFTVSAKRRWLGRTLLDVFTTEFIGHDEQYYRTQIAAGNITINGEKVTCDTKLVDSDLLTHKVHRHEPPVIRDVPKIIAVTDELVVVDKPPSIPVHPCGRYRHNSVMFILAKELHLNNLHSIYRLDRLTSGLMVFARSTEYASRYQKAIQSHAMIKVYLARVRGEFPADPVDVDQPIKIVNFRLGVNQVHPSGKPSSTHFERIRYDSSSNTSVVRCTPRTGRTHQIRVHLQWLGHPIANDPIYSGEPGVLPPNLAHRTPGVEDADDIATRTQSPSSPPAAGTQPATNGLQPLPQQQSDFDPMCPQCQQPVPDPAPDQMCIWLHALSYSCGDAWSYTTEMPAWANA